MFHKVNDVSPMEDYKLSVHFWDGTTKIYNLDPLFNKWPVFKDLKTGKVDYYDISVAAGGYGIIWNDELDLSCDELWENGETVLTPFDGIISFADAAAIWNLNESTLRKAVAHGRLVRGIDVCKYGKQWLISMSAMEREYGKI